MIMLTFPVEKAIDRIALATPPRAMKRCLDMSLGASVSWGLGGARTGGTIPSASRDGTGGPASGLPYFST